MPERASRSPVSRASPYSRFFSRVVWRDGANRQHRGGKAHRSSTRPNHRKMARNGRESPQRRRGKSISWGITGDAVFRHLERSENHFCLGKNAPSHPS